MVHATYIDKLALWPHESVFRKKKALALVAKQQHTESAKKDIAKQQHTESANKDIEIQPGFEPGSSEFLSDALTNWATGALAL